MWPNVDSRTFLKHYKHCARNLLLAHQPSLLCFMCGPGQFSFQCGPGKHKFGHHRASRKMPRRPWLSQGRPVTCLSSCLSSRDSDTPWTPPVASSRSGCLSGRFGGNTEVGSRLSAQEPSLYPKACPRPCEDKRTAPGPGLRGRAHLSHTQGESPLTYLLRRVCPG